LQGHFEATLGGAMRLRDYISRDLTFVIHSPLLKVDCLRELVDHVKQRHAEIDELALLERLIAREEEVTTGIGHGVAIPHATLEGLEHPLCVVAQIPAGIDFLALDASPVHMVFMLLSPPGATGVHIRLLARIARLVDNQDFIARMVTASDAEAVYEQIIEEDERHV
jgi:PTS system nitrogen regulatory IIA component